MGEIDFGKDKDFGLPPSTQCGWPKGEKILYVAILYKQRLEDSNAYKTLLHDRKNVYVHDNSPLSTEDIFPEKKISNVPENLPEGWVYYSDPSNPGLSAAYNAAARYAREHGFEWLMITDQDTAYEPGAGGRYEDLTVENPEEVIFIPKVSIPGGMYISPVKKRFYMARPQGHPEAGSESGRVRLADTAIINSGLLIRLDAFEKCGGYNEKVFLDFSDYQFIDRLSKTFIYGRVIDEEVRQSFSANDDKGESQLNRFRLFCRSLRGYEKPDLTTRIGIGLAVMKRLVSLSIGMRSIKPLGIYLNNYIRH